MSAQIAGEVTCPVCLDLFEDPRLLDCSHSFCKKCLVLLAKPDGISCPTCRKQTKSATNDSTIENLAKNHPLANIADALRKKQKPSSSSVSEEDIRNILLKDKSANDHVVAQSNFHGKYVSLLLLLLENKVVIPSLNKPRILAAAWARRDYELPQLLFKDHGDVFGIPDVVKAVTILDNDRQARLLKKKIEKLKIAGAKGTIVAKYRTELNNTRALDACGSLSGACRKKLKQFIHDIPKEKLEFFLLNFPTKPWQQLADTLHLAPRDFALPWFLACVYGADPPEQEGGTLLGACMRLNNDNVSEVLSSHQVPFSFLRKKVTKTLSAADRCAVAKYTSLHQLLWYYDELNCPELDSIICKKLDEGEDPELGFGKVVELLITVLKPNSPVREKLMPLAEELRAAISLPINYPVLIIGDASSSMSVAVRTATIIAGFIASVCPEGECNLRFFNQGLLPAPYVPRDLTGILDVASKVKANGMTTNAAGLYDVYTKKEVYRTIMMVTDEEENGKISGMNFNALYEKYAAEVFPAKLVFVSFLRQNDEGRMVSELKRKRVPHVQQRFDTRRPDLTKLDQLLGLLAMETDAFDKAADKKAAQLKATNDNDANDAKPVADDADNAAAPAPSSSSSTSTKK